MRILLADGAPSMSMGGGLESTLLMLVFVVAFMYLLVYRPEAKRRKQMEAKRANLKKGDTVIIAGGIVAEFVRMQGNNVVVKLLDGAKMEVLPLAIQDVQPTSVRENKSVEQASE